MVARRFDIFFIALDPTVGHEIEKTRPCVVVSPNEMNAHLGTVIVAPMTKGGKRYPTRVPCAFGGKNGFVVLDQIRTVDKARFVRKAGVLESPAREEVLGRLIEMFAE